MNFNAASLPAFCEWFSWGVLLLLLGAFLRQVRWTELRTGNRLHYWAGATVVLCLLWSLRGNLGPGFDLHLVGATVAVLMFRLPLAACSLLIAVGGATLNANADWQSFALNVLTAAWLPAAVSALWLHWTQRVLPHNYFVYLFVTACLGAVLSVLAVGAVGTALLAILGVRPLDELLADFTPFFILLAFSEAWLTGMAITLMVVWLPGWVVSFDDESYLSQSS